MRLLKIFLALVVLILVLIFLLKNNDQVTVDLIVTQYENLTVSFVMVGALAIGMLIGYGVAIISFLSAKNEVRTLRQKNREITHELK